MIYFHSNDDGIEYSRAGLKFTYQDINNQREVQEAKLKQSNPQKAEQIERLGMGVGNRRQEKYSSMIKISKTNERGK